MEIPSSIGHYVSQWVRETMTYFQKTDYLTNLLETYFPTRTSFKLNETLIKSWLRQGLNEDEYNLLSMTDTVSPANADMKKRRNAIIKRIHRLYKRLELDMFGETMTLENPFNTTIDSLTNNMSTLSVNEQVETPSKSPPIIITTNEEKVCDEKPEGEEKEESKEVCYICQDECDVRLTNCNHVLHKKCKRNALRKGNIYCEICRTPLRKETKEQSFERERKKTIKEILLLLKKESYTLETLKEIQSFLLSAEYEPNDDEAVEVIVNMMLDSQ
jgi:hypothetical protein